MHLVRCHEMVSFEEPLTLDYTQIEVIQESRESTE